ncbi:MAG: hypothetical protein ACI316_06805 [Lactimicrobium massiliense]
MAEHVQETQTISPYKAYAEVIADFSVDGRMKPLRLSLLVGNQWATAENAAAFYIIEERGISMTEQEAYEEHIRYTHDIYCRIVIRHASFDAACMLAARWKQEISLEYLTEDSSRFMRNYYAGQIGLCATAVL